MCCCNQEGQQFEQKNKVESVNIYNANTVQMNNLMLIADTKKEKKRRHFFHVEEFQIIYVMIFPEEGRAYFPLFKVWVVRHDFVHKRVSLK